MEYGDDTSQASGRKVVNMTRHQMVDQGLPRVPEQPWTQGKSACLHRVLHADQKTHGTVEGGFDPWHHVLAGKRSLFSLKAEILRRLRSRCCLAIWQGNIWVTIRQIRA